MNIRLKCKCGKVEGLVKNLSPMAGNHIICMCKDCQAYIKYLGREKDVLDQFGGTEVFQLTPAKIAIDQGAGNLACIKLYKNGLMRWYAKCCNTPIANTMASPKAPFAGLMVTFMDFTDDQQLSEKALDPVIAKIWSHFPKVQTPRDATKIAQIKAMTRGIRLLVGGYIFKQHAPSPFFNADTGKPVAPAIVLTREQRQEL